MVLNQLLSLFGCKFIKLNIIKLGGVLNNVNIVTRWLFFLYYILKYIYGHVINQEVLRASLTPFGVRLARHDTMIILSNIMQKKITDFEQPTRKGVVYGNSKIIIHEHLWLIDGHF